MPPDNEFDEQFKKELEAKEGKVQATKHDQGKPPIFLIPARAYNVLFQGMPEYKASRTHVGGELYDAVKFLTMFKVGGDYSSLAVAGIIVMQALGQQLWFNPPPIPSEDVSNVRWVWAKSEVAKVFSYGANKYKVGNWHAGDGFAWSRLIRAAEGHIDEHFAGSKMDVESKLYHLAHAMCCILMLLEHVLTDFGEDDRAEAQHIRPNMKSIISPSTPLEPIWKENR